jgi:hypothetical protein
MPLLLAGFALLAAGALELAWAPLLAAVLLAAAALAPGRTGQLVLIALSLAPLAPLLAPAFLREAAFHGFYPRGLPVPLFLAVVLAPHTFAVVPIVRGLLPARGSLPRWSPAVAVALVIAFAAAAAIAARQVPCDAASFEALGLACEIAPE